MKSSYFKITSLLIIFVFVFSLLAGCAGSKTQKAEATPAKTEAGSETTTATRETPKEPDPLEIFITERWAGVSYDNMSVHYVEEKTNTKWNVTAVPPEDYDGKLDIYLASGERPDIFQSSINIQKYAEAGILLPLNDYIEKHPNLKKYMADCIELLKDSRDGNVYYLPGKGDTVDFTILYRKDWLDKLGMEIPTTLDEYYDVAVAMSTQDPDGNNKKDTYAFGARGFSDFRYFDHIFAAYGTLPFYALLSEDGQVIDGTIQPGAKEALRYLNKLYTAGAIDPEFVTDNEDRTDQKFKKGMFGATCNYYFVMDTANTYGYYKAFHDNNPGGVLVQGPPLTTPGYKYYGMRSNGATGWIGHCVCKEAKNIDAAFRVFDWLATEEGQMFTWYGKEGEHYKIEDGMVKSLIPIEDYPKYGITQIYLLNDNLTKHYSKEFQQVFAEANKYKKNQPTEGLTVPEWAKYSQLLKDYIKEMYLRMVIGDVPVDGGFEEFVEEYKKRGGEELYKAYNEAYQQRLAVSKK